MLSNLYLERRFAESDRFSSCHSSRSWATISLIFSAWAMKEPMISSSRWSLLKRLIVVETAYRPTSPRPSALRS